MRVVAGGVTPATTAAAAGPAWTAAGLADTIPPMPPRYQEIVDDLLTATAASRVTIRLERPGETLPIVAEALAPGIPSLQGPSTIDLRAAPTVRYLAETLGTLIQDDLLDTDTPPPPELIQQYGARAQMLAAVGSDGTLAAIVSVHYSPGPRHWTEAEVAALEAAAARVRDIIAGA